MDAALAAAIVVLVIQAIDASTAAGVTGGVVAFAGVLGAPVPLQRRNLDAVRASGTRFPTPPGEG